MAGQYLFSKVFKLRSDSGSINIKLVRSRSDAQHYVNNAFGKGFPQINGWGWLKGKFWVLRGFLKMTGFLTIFSFSW
jgi:hypothetical protein